MTHLQVKQPETVSWKFIDFINIISIRLPQTLLEGLNLKRQYHFE